ncbi:uncharacterized protein CEXT_181541 [Caerostris extrusa]|uniref:Uncharacterized protein n=1 Tax=Caerostris extrusa TaxID=172846 RepID=A0AAV4RFC8_CAEEX|nr:uncharacterized protein CEXT_181541 [Caerostris extrusa]
MVVLVVGRSGSAERAGQDPPPPHRLHQPAAPGAREPIPHEQVPVQAQEVRGGHQPHAHRDAGHARCTDVYWTCSVQCLSGHVRYTGVHGTCSEKPNCCLLDMFGIMPVRTCVIFWCLLGVFGMSVRIGQVYWYLLDMLGENLVPEQKNEVEAEQEGPAGIQVQNGIGLQQEPFQSTVRRRRRTGARQASDVGRGRGARRPLLPYCDSSDRILNSDHLAVGICHAQMDINGECSDTSSHGPCPSPKTPSTGRTSASVHCDCLITIGYPGKTNLDILLRFVFHLVTRHSHYIETRTHAGVVHPLKKTFAALFWLVFMTILMKSDVLKTSHRDSFINPDHLVICCRLVDLSHEHCPSLKNVHASATIH